MPRGMVEGRPWIDQRRPSLRTADLDNISTILSQAAQKVNRYETGHGCANIADKVQMNSSLWSTCASGQRQAATYSWCSPQKQARLAGPSCHVCQQWQNSFRRACHVAHMCLQATVSHLHLPAEQKSAINSVITVHTNVCHSMCFRCLSPDAYLDLINP